MHPMFVKLYLENGADDMLAEEEDRHRASRARRGEPGNLAGRPAYALVVLRTGRVDLRTP